MSGVCRAGGKSDESDSLLTGDMNSNSPSRGRKSLKWRCCHIDVSGLLTVYSQAGGGLFIDPALFSASTSVPSFSSSLFFSHSSPPSNGLIFLELYSYHLLSIFEVQIALSRILNFSKSDVSVSLHRYVCGVRPSTIYTASSIKGASPS